MADKVKITYERIRDTARPRSDRGELTLSICVPTVESIKRLTDFYKQIAAECVDFFHKSLPEICEKASDGSSALSYAYRVNVKAEESDDGDLLPFSLRATLCDSSTRKIIAEHTETHIWHLPTQRLRKIKR